MRVFWECWFLQWGRGDSMRQRLDVFSICTNLCDFYVGSVGRIACEIAGSIPAASTFAEQHDNDTSTIKLQSIKTLEWSPAQVSPHQRNTSEHQGDTFLHEKCVICVY